MISDQIIGFSSTYIFALKKIKKRCHLTEIRRAPHVGHE